jgi:hypothetical protein
MPHKVLQPIEADIADAERLITELRFKIAVSQSAGEDTSASEVRLHEMLRVLLLLQDQRDKAKLGAPIMVERAQPQPSVSMKDAGRAASSNTQAGLAGRR